ncbi:MAG: DUF1579 domain-containing protein [Planctomycetaceae bacterium]|nr:DUF1579 domain-containing protein [Planctomycetaceae bacterium]
MQMHALSIVGALGLGMLVGTSVLREETTVRTAEPAVAVEAAATQDMSPEMMRMMEAMTVAGTPGEHHRKLDALAGEWKADITMWMMPDAPAMQMVGSASQAWDFDGRFLNCAFKGDFMGQPFRGMALMGYDNVGEYYTSLWLDNSSTGMMVAKGQLSDDGKQISFSGEANCPIENGPCVNEEVLTIEGPDRWTSVMHTTRGGKRYKSMEIVYTRTKTTEANADRGAR